MQYKEIVVHSLIKKITSKDKLFGGNYTIDPYQNCEVGCLYCDSSIDGTVYIKTNAVNVFENEIRKSRNYTLIIPKSFPKTMGFKKKLFETNPDQDNQSRCRTEVRNYLEEPDIANPPPKESYK